MRFSAWLIREAALLDDDNVNISEASPEEIPQQFIHTTHSPEWARSIADQGFNFSTFGHTASLYGALPSLTQYQPQGIYALEYDEGMEKYETRPYVIFQANIDKALIVREKSSEANVNQSLSQLFGGKAEGELRQALMQQGYQAVLYPDSEQIILDPDIIQVIKIGNAD